MVPCRAKDYLDVIWQPNATQALLWNLIITADAYLSLAGKMLWPLTTMFFINYNGVLYQK